MNRAAAELHTVQSNVTARIRALEARVELGGKLFERRHSRGVALTPPATRLLACNARAGGMAAGLMQPAPCATMAHRAAR